MSTATAPTAVDAPHAATLFEALASEIRLDVVRILVRRGPTGAVAGELATSLGLPASNLSFHLRALTTSGLVEVTREGRYLRYRARMPLLRALSGFLTAECCADSADGCFPGGPGRQASD